MRKVRLEELKEMLRGRGYKNKILKHCIEEGLQMDRDKALEKVEKGVNNSNRVRYTITYDPKLPYISPILFKNWKVMVETDRRLAKPFAAPPMACLKRPVNLSDQLIRSRLSTLQRAGTRGGQVGFRRCPGSRRGCSLCPFTGAAADGKSVVKEVRVNNTGQVINVKQNITCRDDYVLYVLSCTKPGCMAQYAGQTYRQAYIRFREHLDSIQDSNTTCPVGLHWQLPGHKVEHMEFIPVERVIVKDRVIIRQREKDLINSYGFLSAGINRNL